MRARVALAALILILLVLNGLVVRREVVLRMGRSVLLPLAPVDPRSLMQGDYMTLRYAIAADLRQALADDASDGRCVLRLDEKNVGSFVRLDDGSPLERDQTFLRFRVRKDQVRLGAESYFFQEGTGGSYVRARFGELRVADSGDAVLVGLRGEDHQPLGPDGATE